tara:strand:+ start:79 stop:696 length:618 start_codon:yes stop_codon:yes gene_type:complete
MPSDLQVSNIKDLTGSNTGLSIASDGQITVNQNNPTITLGSNATGFTGVKILDQWRLHTNFSDKQDPISSNLERVDNASQATVGSAMTESSGIFTFPMTGIYYLSFHTTHSLTNADGDARYIGIVIQSVISGSSSTTGLSYTSIKNAQSSTTYANCQIDTTFDCTDTSTDKVSFAVDQTSNSNILTLGATDHNYTYMSFIRIGDT